MSATTWAIGNLAWSVPSLVQAGRSRSAWPVSGRRPRALRVAGLRALADRAGGGWLSRLMIALGQQRARGGQGRLDDPPAPQAPGRARATAPAAAFPRG